MDIQKLREEFETLPEIAKVLRVFDVIFDGENYSAKGNHSEVKKVYALGFVNGAWYALQEQQKQIDEIKALAESWINQDYTHNSDSTDIKIQQMKDCGRDIIRKINGE